MSAQKEEQINLLPQKGFQATTTGRVLAWILSTFRIIVIVTEIIVMVAFLSRFWLDAQNTDLTEEIEEKQAVIAASLGFENKFKNTQDRLKIFSELTEKSGLTAKTINEVRIHLPDDLLLTSVGFSEDSLFLMEGVTPNEKSIQQLIVNLQSTKLFKNVDLEEIETDIESPSLLKFKIASILLNQ